MDYSANEVKVGVMVVSGFGLLILFLIGIFGIDFEDNANIYQTQFRNVPGIVKGSLVKFGGMDVGQVTAVELATTGSEILIGLSLKVDARIPIKENSVAYLTSVGIMADPHIEVTPGTPDALVLPSGSYVQSKEVPSFMQMAEPLGAMSEKMEVLLERVSDLFNDENRKELSGLLKNVNGVVADGSQNLVALVENLDQLTANLAEVSDSLNSLMSGNKANFEGTVANLEATTRETSQLVADLRAALAQFQATVSANGTSVVEIMENFQFASQNLEEFTRMVKERPWLLVRKAAPPERKLP